MYPPLSICVVGTHVSTSDCERVPLPALGSALTAKHCSPGTQSPLISATDILASPRASSRSHHSSYCPIPVPILLQYVSEGPARCELKSITLDLLRTTDLVYRRVPDCPQTPNTHRYIFPHCRYMESSPLSFPSSTEQYRICRLSVSCLWKVTCLYNSTTVCIKYTGRTDADTYIEPRLRGR